MGAVNPTLPASTARSEQSSHVRRRSLAGLVVLAAALISSASAWGGIRDYPSDHGTSAAETVLPVSGPLFDVGPLSLLNPDSDRRSSALSQVGSAGNASFSPNAFLIRGSASASATPAGSSPQAVAANDKNSQLLIPLPTGVSAGATGLIGLALLLASKRVRRRLLA
jgi:hypothetical protein